MVPVDGLVRGGGRLRGLLRPSFYSHKPFGVQLLGKRADEIERAAQISQEAGAAVLDLNMGCPARKVVKTGGGAALMKDIDLAAQLVRAAISGVEAQIPVTVKMRTGWDEDDINCTDLARAVEQAGAAWIVVHGRHRHQFCSGTVDFDAIAQVVDAVSIPVFGNGGIYDAESMCKMLAQTGCRGVMVAQGALGRPWIFEELVAAWRGYAPPDKVTLLRRRQIMCRHLNLYLREAAPSRAVREMRKHLAWYSKGVYQGTAFRRRLYRLTQPEQVREHIQNLGCTQG
jgi:nifR3 family TIM-barrel protein